MPKILLQNDAIIFGILFLILWGISYTSSLKSFEKFYRFVPTILLMYFLPSLLNITYFPETSWAFRPVNGEESKLYFVASRYLLPASLVLLTLNIDFPALKKLGPKALIMFLTATLGIVIGGPIAFLLVGLIDTDIVAGDVWRGLTTVAGSWIGGGANQTAMKEIFNVEDEIFSAMITVDVITANIWMGFLIYGAGISTKVDKWLGADSSAIQEIQKRIETYQASIAKVSTLKDFITLGAVAFVCVGIAHLFSDNITPFMESQKEILADYGLNSLTSGFFWIIVVVTTLGLILSLTGARKLEGAGASKMGSLFIYILVAVIGLKMDVTEIFRNPGLFLIGIIWMVIHAGLLILVAKLIKAPFFFLAVGSQANVGGAASAPIVASAFHPSLAPVGALLAVLGYALGTYGALICGELLGWLAN